MMKVPKEHIHLMKSKLKDAPTFVYSVLDSIIKGTVYADSADYKSLLIQTDSGLYYVEGQPTDELFLENFVEIFETAVKEGQRFTLFSPTLAWNEAIERHLDNKIKKIQRYAFSFDEMKYERRKRSDMSAYDLAKIEHVDIQHCLEFDEQYYDEYWDSTRNFLQHGIGFCVKDKEHIISEAVSIFKSSQYAEIDIVTDPNYRGKGLASIVAEQFIDHCLAQQIQPRWDCDVDNSASIHLGSKLGFTNPKEYAIFIKQ